MKASARFATLLALIFGMAWGACQAGPSATMGPVPLSYFGLHAHRFIQAQPWLPGGSVLSPLPSFKFGTWRLWDAYVTWPHLQPERDRWNFSTLDRYVDISSKLGVDLLLPLGQSPNWASARPQEKSLYGLGNAAEPANLKDWRTYVRTVAERYRGRIRLYDIWNEVNLKGFYTGSLPAMVEMARIAHEEIKRIDPEAKIVTPSMTEARSVHWLDEYFALGGGRYTDVVGYHFYTVREQPEALVPFVRAIKEIMTKHGVGSKPLWNTESGWWISNLTDSARVGAAGAGWKKLDQELAAAYVARALLVGWASGLERFYWYAWDNVDMGLYDTIARKEKPAAQAYSRVISWMVGRVLTGCDNGQGVWVCTLVESGGARLHVAWRENGTSQTWNIPVAWHAQTLEMLDGRTDKAGATLLLDSSPVLFR